MAYRNLLLVVVVASSICSFVSSFVVSVRFMFCCFCCDLLYLILDSVQLLCLCVCVC